jgi:hypothetical protein
MDAAAHARKAASHARRAMRLGMDAETCANSLGPALAGPVMASLSRAASAVQTLDGYMDIAMLLWRSHQSPKRKSQKPNRRRKRAAFGEYSSDVDARATLLCSRVCARSYRPTSAFRGPRCLHGRPSPVVVGAKGASRHVVARPRVVARPVLPRCIFREPAESRRVPVPHSRRAGSSIRSRSTLSRFSTLGGARRPRVSRAFMARGFVMRTPRPRDDVHSFVKTTRPSPGCLEKKNDPATQTIKSRRRNGRVRYLRYLPRFVSRADSRGMRVPRGVLACLVPRIHGRLAA